MSRGAVRLSIAINEYDHVRDLLTGRVTAAGVDLTWLELPVEEILQRLVAHGEWEVSECSLALYVALRTSGHRGFIAIPVFPTRMFRHGAIYVRPGAVSDPGALAGRRIGVAEWAQTAGVWVRGILAEHHGVPLDSVEWVRGGVSTPGRRDRVPLALPERLTVVDADADRTLTGMLVDGELDAVISPRPPALFEAGDPRVARLFADPRAAELAYLEKTGIHPIMHVIVVRADVVAAHPWVPRNLLLAFEEARRRSARRIADLHISRLPVPWLGDTVRELADRTPSGEWFPYGIEQNRVALETFCRYAYEQGVAHQRIDDVSTLFDPVTSFQMHD